MTVSKTITHALDAAGFHVRDDGYVYRSDGRVVARFEIREDEKPHQTVGRYCRLENTVYGWMDEIKNMEG